MNMEDGNAFLISLAIKRGGTATLQVLTEDTRLLGHPISYRRMLNFANYFEHIGIVYKVRQKPIRLKVRPNLLKPLTTFIEAVITEGKTI